jgi:hypothetical protein
MPQIPLVPRSTHELWISWREEGPALGYRAECGYVSDRQAVRLGLHITGIENHSCDGFFSYEELLCEGHSPHNLADWARLADIKRHRNQRESSLLRSVEFSLGDTSPSLDGVPAWYAAV